MSENKKAPLLSDFISAARAKVNSKQYCDLLEREFLLDDGDFKCIKEKFKETVTSKKCACVFGAGVGKSKPFNLPNWSELLENAIVGEFKDNYETEKFDFDPFKLDLKASQDYFGSFDLYELGQFLYELRSRANRNDGGLSEKEIEYKTDLEMYGIVKRALERRIKQKCDGIFEKRNDKYSFVSANDYSQKFIFYLCDFAKKYKISKFITYNYDNAFEYAYNGSKSEYVTYPIFIDDQLGELSAKKNEFPIYHVHGYIPLFDAVVPPDMQKSVNNALDSKEGKRLILSESSYDDMAHSSYKWRNVIQIDTFLRNNCIFFGFSATDINFKRIVKLMDWHTEDVNGTRSESDGAVKHYIFMAVNDFIKGIFRHNDNSNSVSGVIESINNSSDSDLSDLQNRLKFLYYTLQMKRKYLRKMHIYPIWCTYEDLPLYIENVLSGKPE